MLLSLASLYQCRQIHGYGTLKYIWVVTSGTICFVLSVCFGQLRCFMISLAAPVAAGAPPEAPNSETEVTLAAVLTGYQYI